MAAISGWLVELDSRDSLQYDYSVAFLIMAVCWGLDLLVVAGLDEIFLKVLTSLHQVLMCLRRGGSPPTLGLRSRYFLAHFCEGLCQSVLFS